MVNVYIVYMNSVVTHFYLFLLCLGLILSKMFIDIIYDLITLNLGSNMLPDAWMHLTIYDVGIYNMCKPYSFSLGSLVMLLGCTICIVTIF